VLHDGSNLDAAVSGVDLRELAREGDRLVEVGRFE
jgi:hypothetical protein